MWEDVKWEGRVCVDVKCRGEGVDGCEVWRGGCGK